MFTLIVVMRTKFAHSWIVYRESGSFILKRKGNASRVMNSSNGKYLFNFENDLFYVADSPLYELHCEKTNKVAYA